MDVPTLTSFFLWCTVLNVGLLLFWSAWFLFAPDLVYRTQKRFVPISREQFDLVMYGFLGLFKIAVIVLNVMPYVALRIIGS